MLGAGVFVVLGYRVGGWARIEPCEVLGWGVVSRWGSVSRGARGAPQGQSVSGQSAVRVSVSL